MEKTNSKKKIPKIIIITLTVIMDIVSIIIGLVIGWVGIFAYNTQLAKKQTTEAESKAKQILQDAENSANKLLRESQSQSDKIKNEAREEAKKIDEDKKRITQREEKLEAKLESIEKKFEELSHQKELLSKKTQEIEKTKNELEGKIAELSKLSEQEAKEIYLKEIAQKYSDDGAEIIKKYKDNIEERKKEEAREIILRSIQQYAGDVTSEVTTTLIPIPSDDIKGKLIGKEGRNITAFEKAAWVALIIDDTPDSVFISGFDLYRRYVAKKSLEKLIEDGRIQPARIEEVVKATEQDAETLLRELGNQVVNELGITKIPKEIIPVIGKLRFRTSYGQNILKHSKEVALIAERLAYELGADSNIIKIGGLLHDIGKALDQELEWTHPELWGILARKYKMDERVIDMIENHHGEPLSISLEAAIVQVADAISSVRPGARREVIEDYLKRVQEMEALAQSFSGISRAFALSAGREIRVFVNSDIVNDVEAMHKAKEIAESIQEKLSYPWEVKVNVIRETRVIEYAK